MKQRPVVIAIAAIAGIALLVISVSVIGGWPKLAALSASLFHGDVSGLKMQLTALGARAALALVLLVLAHTVLPFPAEILAIAGGFALGAAVAYPLLLASFVASALIAYWVGARWGSALAAMLVGPQRLALIERRVDRAGAAPLLAVRLFPLLPFSPVCLVCGVVRVPVRRYVWTTAVGIAPELGLVTLLGSRLRSPHLTDPALWIPLAGLLALVVLVPSVYRRLRVQA